MKFIQNQMLPSSLAKESIGLSKKTTYFKWDTVQTFPLRTMTATETEHNFNSLVLQCYQCTLVRNTSNMLHKSGVNL